jgi:hypothetical protein
MFSQQGMYGRWIQREHVSFISEVEEDPLEADLHLDRQTVR